MEICSTRQLWSPNVWATAEVVDATVRVEPADLAPPTAELLARIDAALPDRARLFGPFAPPLEHAEDSAFLDAPRLLAEIALTLQSRARGPESRFYRVLGTCEPRLFRLAIEARDPVLARECLEHAARLLADFRLNRPVDANRLIDELIDRADDVCLGPSTMLIVRAALARGIPFRRMSELSLVQFGHGHRQRRIWTAETDRTPAIAEAISRNKQLTKRLLEAAGVPVPRGRVVDRIEDAWQAASAVGLPVVVKPLDGNHGRGVFLNLSTREEIERAFPIALAEGRTGSPVIIEQFVAGVEHRILVVGSKMLACAQGEYLYITGDGRANVRALIETQINGDARRGRSETLPNDLVEIDSTVLAQLEQEGVTPDTIPAAGQRLLVKRIGSHGPDVTARVHPEIAAAAVRAARTVGLDVAGIDFVASDISQPLLGQGAMVCEVNAGPQLLIHAYPKDGPGQPVGEAIVDQLFAPGETGRIPVVAIIGRPGTVVASLVERMLRAAGRAPALTSAAGKFVAGWHSATEPHNTPDAARDVLMSPDIDSAVFELDWRAIVRQGLPTDRLNVVVLLDPGEADPVEPADVERIDSALAAAAALARAVDTGGTIVALAGQRDLLEKARASGRGLIEVVALDDHVPPGDGRRVLVVEHAIVYRDGDDATLVCPLSETLHEVDGLPIDHTALLAATAAGVALNLPLDAIRQTLTTRLP
jgi:cyanophycin synthetase